MSRPSIKQTYQQFGWKLAIIAIIVVILFTVMYVWEKQRSPIETVTPPVPTVTEPTPIRN